MKESSIACHLRHLKAAFSWAVKMGLMVRAPIIEMPDAGEAKSRAVTAEEFERMLQVAAEVRPHDPGIWTRYLYGMWLSGLRLKESIAFSWDEDADFAVDLSGTYPAFRIRAAAQKGRRSETVPMTPDLATWLLETPEEDRTGPVFQLPSLLDGEPLTPCRVGRIVSRIGKKANVIVSRETGWVREPVLDEDGKKTGATKLVEKEVIKHATVHDLRRSFCSRWARKVMPAVLQQLARHRSITTTMTYYVRIKADEVAADLWAEHETGGSESVLGTTLGTSESSQLPAQEKGA
jgi:integrase